MPYCRLPQLPWLKSGWLRCVPARAQSCVPARAQSCACVPAPQLGVCVPAPQLSVCVPAFTCIRKLDELEQRQEELAATVSGSASHAQDQLQAMGTQLHEVHEQLAAKLYAVSSSNLIGYAAF